MKPNFALAAIFADNMIFQAGRPVKLFGTCKKKTELRFDWNGESYKIKTDAATFLYELPALPVTKTPFSFSISSRNQTVTISNCLAGDVIVCGGEGNMQFTLKQAGFETRPVMNRAIRFFDVPKLPYPDADLDDPRYFSSEPQWFECDRVSALAFSAIGYYVAQNLKDEIDTPIGIIACTQPDTSVFAWANMIDLSANPALAKHISSYRTEIAKYSNMDEYHKAFNARLPKRMEYLDEIASGVAAGLAPDEAEKAALAKFGDCGLPMGPKHWNRPSGAFDAMVKTILPFPIKAVLYYQGESDRRHADLYEQAFKTMVKSWRAAFDDPTLPFVFAQLAGYHYPGLGEPGIALVREAQAACINATDNIFMASAVDLGEERNLHPKDKREIARRMINVLLEKVYRKGKNSGSPALFSYQFGNGKLVVYTQYNNLNLVSHCGQNLGFTLVCDDGRIAEHDRVELTGNQIVVRDVGTAKEVRYCFANAPHCDIYSANELPLLPFRIKLD